MHLREVVSQLPGKLEAPVQENGANFSVGASRILDPRPALIGIQVRGS